MTQLPASESDRHVAFRQSAYSLLLLVVTLGTYKAVSILAQDESIAQHIFSRQMDRWQQNNGAYTFHVGFIDSEDRLFLHDLPIADYSKGGVFFIGSSTTQHSVIDWELPPEERECIHNDAIKSANYKEQFQFVRYLVEEEGILKAGGENVLVVLGLCHLDARPKLPGTSDWDFFPRLFERYAPLYEYDSSNSLSKKPMSELERWLRLERLRDYSFLKSLWTEYTTFQNSKEQPRPKKPNAAEARGSVSMQKMMGGEKWQQAQDVQLGELEQMIDYLQVRKVKIKGVLLPIASWNHSQPYAARFAQKAGELCALKSVPLIDLSRTIADEGFHDATHMNCQGHRRTGLLLQNLAREHLYRRETRFPSGSALERKSSD